MMVSERMLPPLPPEDPPLDPVTVIVALELTGPLYAVALAATVVVPALTPVTRPDALTVATAGTVELQVTPLVTS
jgi:hypothetical protein